MRVDQPVYVSPLQELITNALEGSFYGLTRFSLENAALFVSLWSLKLSCTSAFIVGPVSYCLSPQKLHQHPHLCGKTSICLFATPYTGDYSLFKGGLGAYHKPLCVFWQCFLIVTSRYKFFYCKWNGACIVQTKPHHKRTNLNTGLQVWKMLKSTFILAIYI